jgi:hypothetical protein
MSADALERLVLGGVVVAVGLVILTISVIALPPLHQPHHPCQVSTHVSAHPRSSLSGRVARL